MITLSETNYEGQNVNMVTKKLASSDVCNKYIVCKLDGKMTKTM